MKIEKWICTSCKFLLGIVEDSKLVRIKRKDLYVSIEGGKITVNCCRCGKVNELIDDKITVAHECDLKEGRE